MSSSFPRLAIAMVAALLLVGCTSAPITTPPPTSRAPITTPPSTASPGLGRTITAIAAGDAHTCALTSNGAVKCWGSNDSGRLGNGSTTHSSVPVGASGLAGGVTAIAAGGDHSCALTIGGGVTCWGTNSWGQLGNGGNADSGVPVGVSGLTSGVAAIAAGGWHTCALTSGGGVKCWGTDAYQPDCGESPCTIESSDLPVEIAGLGSGVSAIAAGGHHTCALTSGGAVKCWGGELGNGSTTDSSVPVDVADLASGVRAIAAGGHHTCAVLNGGGVRCWGVNDQGELGDGTSTYSIVPVGVAGLPSGVTAIAAGYTHTCVLTGSGRVTCWGANWRGQLGNGSTTGGLVPVDVVGLAP